MNTIYTDNDYDNDYDSDYIKRMEIIGSYYVYLIDLPPTIKAAVTPCLDGYTIYINENLSEPERIKAYEHERAHIENNDFGKTDVQEIERPYRGESKKT